MKKYSKIRLILSILLALLLVIISIEIFSSGAYWFPVALILAGSILFSINKRWADYISFSVFVFIFIYAITFILESSLNTKFSSVSIYHILTTDKVGSFALILSGLISTFLATSFFRNTNLK
jgi:hypothetical protein